MADFSIDQNNLPGVKEVCRDFAVLEDHCLAHNLQEQEIESHLASNVHKSRLVQQDLRVAKRLQEEEDQRAKAESRRQYQHIERIDNEIAQEIQEQLVRQAELQRQQEEKDEAIARRLQEREMKEERKRQKQKDTDFEEYYDDQASRPPLDPQDQHPAPNSPGYRKERYRDYSRSGSNSSDPDSKRYPKNGTHNTYPEHDRFKPGQLRPPESPNRGRFPEYGSPEQRAKHPKGYSKERNGPLEADYIEPHRRKKQEPMDVSRLARDDQEPVVCRNRPLEADYKEPHRRKKQEPMDVSRLARDHQEPVVRRKEKPPKESQDGVWDKERNGDKEPEEHGQKRDRPRNRDHRARSQDRTFSGERVDGRDRQRGRNLDRENLDRNCYRHASRDRLGERGRDKSRDRHKSRDKHHSRDRSSERAIDDYSVAENRGCSEDRLEWEDHKNRQRLSSGPNEVFEEPNLRGPSNEGQSPGHSSRERGRRPVRGEYGMREATHGLAQLDLEELELRDLEVARRLQEEEIKASQIDKRAAQVAKDEELARLLMEEEKRGYKKSRDKEKQAMERRRAEMEYKPLPEDVVRPRTRDEVFSGEDEYQRVRNHKPARPPPPTQHYENINPSYAYVESPYSSQPPGRPEAAYKGAYYRQ